MTGPLCRSAVEWARVGARAASISSVTTYRSSCERSWPPYFFGQVMPIQPLAPTRRLNSRENDPLPSPGTKVPASASWRKNARTSRRNSLASGGNSIGSKRKLKFIDVSGGSPACFETRPLALLSMRCVIDGTHRDFLILRCLAERGLEGLRKPCSGCLEERASDHHEPWVIKDQSWSAPCAATIRPKRWAHSVSLPNSSRHAHSRRVAWCSECS